MNDFIKTTPSEFQSASDGGGAGTVRSSSVNVTRRTVPTEWDLDRCALIIEADRFVTLIEEFGAGRVSTTDAIHVGKVRPSDLGFFV